MYQETLQRISDQIQPPGGFQPPAATEALERLAAAVRDRLGTDVPAPYLEFLRRTNGLDFNGLVLYAAERSPIVGRDDLFIEGFLDANLDQRELDGMDRFLVFGESGLSSYCYNLDDQRFEVRDRASFSRPEPQPSFEAMLADALEQHA